MMMMEMMLMMLMLMLMLMLIMSTMTMIEMMMKERFLTTMMKIMTMVQAIEVYISRGNNWPRPDHTNIAEPIVTVQLRGIHRQENKSGSS